MGIELDSHSLFYLQESTVKDELVDDMTQIMTHKDMTRWMKAHGDVKDCVKFIVHHLRKLGYHKVQVLPGQYIKFTSGDFMKATRKTDIAYELGIINDDGRIG